MSAASPASGTHPAATDPAPFFFPGADGSDSLTISVGLFLLFSVLAFGLIFLRVHTLPERIAHKGHKLQFEIVAVLGLLALLTHIHLFWVAGLILALIDLPDIMGVSNRIADSLDRIASNTARPVRRQNGFEAIPARSPLKEDRSVKENLTDA
jgi:hypothetical protein